MRMRPVLAAAVGCALAVGLAGCASVSGGVATSPSVPEPSAAPGDAVDLLGTVWHVHGAAGADPATYLLFSADEVEVLEPKGEVSGPWSVQGDQMLAMTDSWSMSLGTNREPSVPWLTSATSFQRTQDGWLLKSATGRTLATLADDGPAPPKPDAETTPRPVDRYARAQVADAIAGSGAGVDSGSLVGRWAVPGLETKQGLLTLKSNGTWETSGGCIDGGFVAGGGAYRLESGGVLLNTALPRAAVGCAVVGQAEPPADAAALVHFSAARSLRLDGDHLTLFDKAGKRIGTLTRVGA